MYIHAVLGEVSLDIFILSYLVLSRICEREAIGISWVIKNSEIAWHLES